MFKKLLFGLLAAATLLASPAAEAQKKTVILNLGSGKGIPLPVVNGECIIGVGTVAQWGACSGAGTAVTSVTGTAGQIAASPTTGDVVLTLPNTITEALTFSSDTTLNGVVSGTGITDLFASPPAIGGTAPAAIKGTTGTFTGDLTTNITGSTQCVHVDTSGVMSGSGADCGSGSGGITALTGDVTASGTGSVAASVVRLQGRAMASTAPTNGQALTWVAGSSDWEPTTLAGTGTVVSVATTSPITGGTITGSGTIACATCVTSAASLTSTAIMTGAGSQASQTDANATLVNGALALGASGTVGSVTMGNGTSGTGFLKFPATGALGTSGITFPIGATDFSATGGTSQVVKQVSAGAALTVGQEAFTDISGNYTFSQGPTIATNTILGNSSGSTGVPSAQTVGAGLVMNANGLATTVPDRTANNGITIGTGDMGGFAVLTGTGNMPMPTIGPTLMTTGMTFSYQNGGSGIITLTGTLPIQLPHAAQPPGAFGTIVGNGSTIDWTGLTTPTATAIGGVMSKDCTSGGQFVQIIGTDGTITCNTPAGGGDISSVGNLTVNGVVYADGSKSINATAVGTNGIPLIGQTGAPPIYGTAVVGGGGTGLTTATAHGVLFGEGTGNFGVSTAGATGDLFIGQGNSDPIFATAAYLSGTGGSTLTLGGNAGGNAGAVVLNSATSGGAITFSPAATASTFTATAPANTGTISETNLAEAFTAVKTFTNSDIKLLGSSTGATTFTSDNAGASNFTMHIPAENDTLVDLAGSQVLTNKTLTAAALGSSTATTQSALDNSTKVATTAYVDKATNAVLSSGSISATGTRELIYCTTTCTVTLPVPAVGYQFCVANNVGVSTVITIAAVSTVLYGKTDQSSYGTVSTGTMVSGGATGDKVCLIGVDGTHYNVGSYNGVWTNS